MTDDRQVPHDDAADVLARLSNAIVQAQKEFFGKGPERARTYIVDDLVFVVMRGGLTTAEKTMLQFGHPDLVRQFRQLFENEMTARLTGAVEEILGRRVLTYQSQVLFDPNIVIEMFVLDAPAPTTTRETTATGQLREDGTGEATDDEALEGPSERGHE
jgi:uncharacterized protein YbcI